MKKSKDAFGIECNTKKSSVIWAEPHSRSSAEQFGWTKRSVGHYVKFQCDKSRNTEFILMCLASAQKNA